MRLTALAICVVSPLLPAQLVSPAKFTSVYGSRIQASPFGEYAQYRYQQIHDDLRGAPQVLANLAFRRGFAATGAEARVVEVEVWIGYADWNARGGSFGSNVVGSPTRVVARRQVALPSWQADVGFPAPFDARIVFDQPWFYDGTRAFAWEVRVFSNSTAVGPRAQPYLADGFREISYGGGPSVKNGQGCMPVGRFVEMRSNLMVLVDREPSPRYTLVAGFGYGPRSQPCASWVGTTDPNASIPGACTDLRVGNLIAAIGGTTDPGGFFAPNIVVPYQPALVGVDLFGQGVAIDAGRSGLPVTISSGRKATIPALPPAPVRVASVAARGDAFAVAGSLIDYNGMIVQLN